MSLWCSFLSLEFKRWKIKFDLVDSCFYYLLACYEPFNLQESCFYISSLALGHKFSVSAINFRDNDILNSCLLLAITGKNN